MSDVSFPVKARIAETIQRCNSVITLTQTFFLPVQPFFFEMYDNWLGLLRDGIGMGVFVALLSCKRCGEISIKGEIISRIWFKIAEGMQQTLSVIFSVLC